MVKKKRKIKQKRTDSQERSSVPTTPEQVPLSIDIATPQEDELPKGVVIQPDSRRTNAGEVQVSGSIVGLASGEIHVDPELALAVHFGDPISPSRKSSVEINDEGAIIEEVVPIHRTAGEPKNAEDPTPAPLVPATQLHTPSFSPAVVESPDTVENNPQDSKQRRRKRRNTLPQVGTVPHPLAAPIITMSDQNTFTSEGYTIFSGEIEIVPEEDSPPAIGVKSGPSTAFATNPLSEVPPEEVQKMVVFQKEIDLPVAISKTPVPSNTHPTPVPLTPVQETSVSSESAQDSTLAREELEEMQRLREERRAQLRKLVASLPLPFSMNLPDKTQNPSDEGFAPAVLKTALPPLGSQRVHPAVTAHPTPETVPVAPETVPVAPETVPVAPETVPVAPETVPVAPETVPVASETVPAPVEQPKTKKVATPLENSLVSTQMSALEPMMSGRLRASSRSDIPVKGFSDFEEEFFDQEIHPENDYSGLDEVFANIQEQQPSTGFLGSLRRLFVADAPLSKNTTGKQKNKNASKNKGNNNKKEK